VTIVFSASFLMLLMGEPGRARTILGAVVASVHGDHELRGPPVRFGRLSARIEHLRAAVPARPLWSAAARSMPMGWIERVRVRGDQFHPATLRR